MKTFSLLAALLGLAVAASAAGFVPKHAKDLITCSDVDAAISTAKYHKIADKAYLASLDARHAALNCGQEKECPVLDKQMASEQDGWARKMHASRRLRLACPGPAPAIPPHKKK